ncbi:MAG: DUF4170 domain-containing protein [Rhodospirillales bacterium]|jgi:hypothetical protein|nr:hypothetical protein [Rhodospirillaceae bacterium]MDP6430084.1 DUF4170 domain-containing protein [Rhodospirillales bacterium]MDP6643102.1 DUF4170 domain-containing protein [Rhodospirillales bacterium]|tara:strand:- start:1341 stop:1607 length:267 start_codon:yes stop_codon:yes gene_type:complete
MSDPLLHLVFGGEVADPSGNEFVDASKLDNVGIFPSYAEALTAWQGVSRANVDHAHIKYVIVHLHRLMDPDHPVPKFQERASDNGGGR